MSQSAVSRIIARAKAGGLEALRRHKPPGRRSYLIAEQQKQLLNELAQEAEAHGFAGDLWTARRIAQFIAQRFGVNYHPDHIGPLLRQLGWSPQRPIARASQRNEAAIEQWAEVTWPEIKKALTEERSILFIDESAFYLLPGVVRTWAPLGKTLILHCKLTREHYSVISAIAPTGELYLTMRSQAFDSAGIIAFLDQLQQQIDGKLLIIWDGAPIHRSKAIQAYPTADAAERIWLERLPGYAPDLNPDEDGQRAGGRHSQRPGPGQRRCHRQLSSLPPLNQ